MRSPKGLQEKCSGLEWHSGWESLLTDRRQMLKQGPLLDSKIARYLLPRIHIANDYAANGYMSAIADMNGINQAGAGTDPHIIANTYTAVHDGAVPDI